MAKKKEEKHTGTNEQMDAHAHSILEVLRSIDAHMASLAYHQMPSRGLSAEIEKAAAAPYMSESKKTLKDKIRAIAIEELRKLNEENK
jgi:hypothetical protein